MKSKTNQFGHLYFMLLFPVVIFYYEVVFRIATVGGIFKMSTLYMLLFSCAYGCIGYLLSTIFKNRFVNKIITAVLLGLTSLAYIVQFLIYKQFKVFYDLNTMTGGAGDALTSYTKELFVLIFNIGSLFVIILLALPTVLYCIFGEKYVTPFRSNWKVRLISFGTSSVCFLLAFLLISVNSLYAPKYKVEYNYQTAVSEFGLITGLRLDIKEKIFGKGSSEFEKVTSTMSEEALEESKEYGLNQLEIDFEALNSGANDTVKRLNQYVSSQTASNKNKYTGMFEGKNLIMITAEAFSASVIDKELTPTLYRLATKGINFTDYYQPSSAGTTGGEYQNVFGMLPMAGGKSFKNTANTYNYFTMGSQLNRLGYYGKAFHNNSYTYYDRNITHNNLGYSDGFMGYGNGMEQYVKNYWPQSDYEMISGTLPTYIDKEKFNVYYMSVSGHSGYSTTGNSMTARHWERVKHLNYSDDVKGYLAANLDFEDALTHLVSELEKKGIADDTVIVISTDHFPYGLDSDAKLGNMPYLSELYGTEIKDYFQRDYSRLIIWSGCLEDSEPIIVDSPTFSLDILPTLSNLFGTEFDSRFMVGRDVFSKAEALVFNTNYDWKTDLGTYYSSSGKFVPKDSSSSIPEDYVENMKAIVRNKIKYCTDAPGADYFRHVFG